MRTIKITAVALAVAGMISPVLADSKISADKVELTIHMHYKRYTSYSSRKGSL